MRPSLKNLKYRICAQQEMNWLERNLLLVENLTMYYLIIAKIIIVTLRQIIVLF